MQSATRDPASTGAAVGSNAKPRGWWRRNWKRLILAIIVLAVLGAGGGYYYQFGRILISEPYRQAMADLRQSPIVKQMLGEPIKDNWFPVGTINNSDGDARFILKLHGPKTPNGKQPKAEASVTASVIDHKWGINALEVTSEEGERKSLRDELEALYGSDVPPFDPKTVPPPLPKTDAAPPPDVKIDLPPDLPSDSGNK